MYTRLMTVQKLLEHNQSLFLFGPRGVGKTNWLRAHIKTESYIDLLDSRKFRALSSDPSRLETYILNPKDWVIVDEVQRIPELLNEVHRLIESHKIRFILTGSSARKLKKMGVNLLAGRALIYHMFPLTALELGGDFSLSKSLQRGHLPMAYLAKDAEAFLESYVQTYLREEVLQEGIVRNVAGFNRFLEAASFSQGQYLNVSKVAADCGVERKVVESYFQVIEDLLLSVRLPHFKKKAERKTDFHPKFFFFDLGVYRTLRPQGPEDEPEQMEGALFESLVYQEIRAMNFYEKWDFQIYCWRHSSGEDVDLVLYSRKHLVAVEIKRASRLRGGELKGLLKFKELYPSAQLLFIYGGKEKRKIDGVHLLPCDEFLKNMKNYLSSHP